MKTGIRLLLTALLCTLVGIASGAAQDARPADPALARLAELVWRDGEARQFPATTSEAFGYGARQVPYRVLVVKTSDDDRHEAMVVALDDGSRALHLARRLPNDLWIIRSSLSGGFAKGFHRLYPKGAPIEMEAGEGQQIIDRESAFWLEWLKQHDSRSAP
jgi:hypothetical protein